VRETLNALLAQNDSRSFLCAYIFKADIGMRKTELGGHGLYFWVESDEEL
jgi:hypothetical protein